MTNLTYYIRLTFRDSNRVPLNRSLDRYRYANPFDLYSKFGFHTDASIKLYSAMRPCILVEIYLLLF